jgi:hypothetical protein
MANKSAEIHDNPSLSETTAYDTNVASMLTSGDGERTKQSSAVTRSGQISKLPAGSLLYLGGRVSNTAFHDHQNSSVPQNLEYK